MRNNSTKVVKHIPVVDAVFRGITPGKNMRVGDDYGYNELVVWDLGVDAILYPRTEKRVVVLRFGVDKRQEVIDTARHLALSFGEGAILQEIAYYDTPNTDAPTKRFVVKHGELQPLDNETSLAIFNDISDLYMLAFNG